MKDRCPPLAGAGGIRTGRREGLPRRALRSGRPGWSSEGFSRTGLTRTREWICRMGWVPISPRHGLRLMDAPNSSSGPAGFRSSPRGGRIFTLPPCQTGRQRPRCPPRPFPEATRTSPPRSSSQTGGSVKMRPRGEGESSHCLPARGGASVPTSRLRISIALDPKTPVCGSARRSLAPPDSGAEQGFPSRIVRTLARPKPDPRGSG